MQPEIEAGHKVAHQETLVVRVRYIGAREPFVDPKAHAMEALNAFKPRVLAFFKLVEGDAEGGTKAYTFAADGVAVTNVETTLGTLAAGKHELKLDLLEQFKQG